LLKRTEKLARQTPLASQFASNYPRHCCTIYTCGWILNPASE
jgi:hypothetical protein